MVGNPKKSKWRSTPSSDRKRKKVQFTLSDEAREKLDQLAPKGTQSEFIESLIMKA